ALQCEPQTLLGSKDLRAGCAKGAGGKFRGHDQGLDAKHVHEGRGLDRLVRRNGDHALVRLQPSQHLLHAVLAPDRGLALHTRPQLVGRLRAVPLKAPQDDLRRRVGIGQGLLQQHAARPKPQRIRRAERQRGSPPERHPSSHTTLTPGKRRSRRAVPADSSVARSLARSLARWVWWARGASCCCPRRLLQFRICY
ncbi:hypothetical protein T484DRAFT_2546900, partial [Baffinella frigidus]